MCKFDFRWCLVCLLEEGSSPKPVNVLRVHIIFLKIYAPSCYPLIEQSSFHVCIHSVIHSFIQQMSVGHPLRTRHSDGTGVTMLGQSRNELLPTHHEVTVLGKKDIIQVITQTNIKLHM